MAEQKMTVDRMKRFLDCFNRHDVEAILSFFAEDGVFETTRGTEPSGKRVVGKEAIGAYFSRMFQTIPDTHFGEDSHWLSEDASRGVSEWTLSGTQPDGSRVAVRGCDLFRFEGGRIVRKDSYLKQQG